MDTQFLFLPNDKIAKFLWHCTDPKAFFLFNGKVSSIKACKVFISKDFILVSFTDKNHHYTCMTEIFLLYLCNITSDKMPHSGIAAILGVKWFCKTRSVNTDKESKYFHQNEWFWSHFIANMFFTCYNAQLLSFLQVKVVNSTIYCNDLQKVMHPFPKHI